MRCTYFVCVDILGAPYVCSMHKGQKMTLDSLKLELCTVVCHHVGPGTEGGSQALLTVRILFMITFKGFCCVLLSDVWCWGSSVKFLVLCIQCKAKVWQALSSAVSDSILRVSHLPQNASNYQLLTSTIRRCTVACNMTSLYIFLV